MKGRIVIADDEPLVRMDFVEYLEDNNYEVVGEASNGVEAIKVCEETIPDIVLMDIKMPLLDGLSATKKILENHWCRGGVIILSAYSNDEHIKEASEIGAGGYLVKPLDEKSLIPTIEMVKAKGSELSSLSEDVIKLKAKLEDRKLIDRAKGIIETKEHLNEEAAYKYLRDNCMKYRMSMHDFSEMIIEGDRGETGESQEA